MNDASAGLSETLEALRAAAEETRLRMLALLAEGELSVSDLTDILGQSQPRISRHLKLLVEAGLVERHREGAWAFFRLDRTRRRGPRSCAPILAALDRGRPRGSLDDRVAPRRRAGAARPQAAQAFFARLRAEWDRHPLAARRRGRRSRRRCSRPLGREPIRDLLDLGTGTGRMLQLLAPRGAAAPSASTPATPCCPSPAPTSRRRVCARRAAPGRHLRAAVRARHLRPRRHPPGAALSRRSGPGAARGGAARCARRAHPHRRFRAARPGIPARGPGASPARLRARAGRGLARRGRSRLHADARDRAARKPATTSSPSRSGSARTAASSPIGRSPARTARSPDGLDRIPPEPRTALGRIKVSFEFFPPKTPEMEATLWASIERLAPLAAELRLGDLRRRRLDARAHARDRRAPRARDAPEARRAPHLRRRDARRDRRGRALLLGRRRAPHRGAARRSGRAARHAPTSRIPAATSRPAISSPASSAIGDFEVSVVGLSGEASRGRPRSSRHRRAQAQGRLRRRPGHHPVLLR